MQPMKCQPYAMAASFYAQTIAGCSVTLYHCWRVIQRGSFVSKMSKIYIKQKSGRWRGLFTFLADFPKLIASVRLPCRAEYKNPPLCTGRPAQTKYGDEDEAADISRHPAAGSISTPKQGGQLQIGLEYSLTYTDNNNDGKFHLLCTDAAKPFVVAQPPLPFFGTI